LLIRDMHAFRILLAEEYLINFK